jgi:hypothetical protein
MANSLDWQLISKRFKLTKISFICASFKSLPRVEYSLPGSTVRQTFVEELYFALAAFPSIKVIHFVPSCDTSNKKS